MKFVKRKLGVCIVATVVVLCLCFVGIWCFLRSQTAAIVNGEFIPFNHVFIEGFIKLNEENMRLQKIKWDGYLQEGHVSQEEYDKAMDSLKKQTEENTYDKILRDHIINQVIKQQTDDEVWASYINEYTESQIQQVKKFAESASESEIGLLTLEYWESLHVSPEEYATRYQIPALAIAAIKSNMRQEFLTEQNLDSATEEEQDAAWEAYLDSLYQSANIIYT